MTKTTLIAVWYYYAYEEYRLRARRFLCVCDYSVYTRGGAIEPTGQKTYLRDL